MTATVQSARALKWWLAVTLFGSATLTVPSAVEPFMLPKATLIVLSILAMAAWWSIGAFGAGRVVLTLSPAAYASLAFLVAAFAATVTSNSVLTSVVGWYGRYTGLASYASYVVLFWMVSSRPDHSLFDLLRRTGVAALALVVLYGLLQDVGGDPVQWVGNGLGQTFSLLGNVDFAAAWVGAALALAVATACKRSEPRAWRWFAGALVPLAMLYVLVTGTSQGPVIAVISLAWALTSVGLAPGSWLRRLVAARPRMVGAVLAVVTLTVGAAVVLGLALVRAQLTQALVERPYFWETALRIWRAHPIVGSGLDTFGNYFLFYRPKDHALANGPATADAPHSVPLAMLSNGGLLLALSYVVFVAIVGFLLVRRTWRTTGDDRTALAAFGGVWLGYQAQSLVSYDVPSLAILHWLSAAVVVALLSAPRRFTWQNSGASVTRTTARRRSPYGQQSSPGPTPLLRTGAICVAVVAGWFATYPLRADLVAASAAPLAKTGQLDKAIEKLQHAARLNPAEGSYPFLIAQAQAAAGRPAAALENATEAAHREPGSVQYSLLAGQLAGEVGDGSAASRWYLEAVARDPRDPRVLTVAAEFMIKLGHQQTAHDLIDRALRLEPANPTALALRESLADHRP